MPELPEVESIRLQLEKFLVGHTVLDLDIRRPKIFEGEKENVIGSSILAVRRFAKVLSIDLSNKYSLLIHVKLTGQIIYRGPRLANPSPLSKKVVGGVPGPHTHVIFKLDKEGFLYYNDVRRFGWIRVMKTDEVQTSGFVGKLGPEPFGTLTLQKFKDILSGSKKAIKVLLMDQEKIGGVGNIYANDALWLTKIHPTRPANTLTDQQMSQLYESILKVLKEGLKYGGASELAFVTPDGQEGGYQKHFLAYAQEGQPCVRCKRARFVKTVVGGRGTYTCPVCQIK